MIVIGAHSAPCGWIPAGTCPYNAPMTDKPHRNTLFVEDAPVLAHDSHAGDQYVLRVQAPRCAGNARAGHFAHLQCDPALPMRRPLSIMRVDADAG